MQKKFLFSFLALAAFAVPACGGSTSSGPVVTAADATDVDNGDGTFDITLDITYDDDVVVVQYNLDCSDGVDPSNDILESGPLTPEVTTGTAELNFTVTATDFNYSCLVSVTDDSGIDSATFQFDFDLAD